MILFLQLHQLSSHCTACDEGFYGDQCASRCQCRNASECDFMTGSCTCQAGFTGSTCHESCPDGAYGLGCALMCECFTRGTMSCDPTDGSCDCNEMWMGELCEGKNYYKHLDLKVHCPSQKSSVVWFQCVCVGGGGGGIKLLLSCNKCPLTNLDSGLETFASE